MTQPNMKFRIKTPEHSKAIQKKLFEMEIGWHDGGPVVQHTDKAFLYVEGRFFGYGETEQFFTEDPSTECILTKDGKITPLVDDEGYIYWEGGECPVPEGTLVDVKYRNGHKEDGIPALVFDLVNPGQRHSAYNWSAGLGGGTIVAYKLSEKQPAVEPPAPQKQPLTSLRPQKEMWLDRAAELLAAMSLCIDREQKIPCDWIDELYAANDHL